MFQESRTAKIKVMGVGGGGGNSINDMYACGFSDIELIVANTDIQDLLNSEVATKVQLGEKITKGLGAGANPEVGRLAAEEDRDKIKAALAGTDLLFITAGLGGGTGTGASPVIAKIAKDMGILTVAVVTKPFAFEGQKRIVNAEEGFDKLAAEVDTVVVIPNDKLFEISNKGVSLVGAFEEANNVLRIGIRSIADLITNQGLINLDFADVRTVMENAGVATLGFGYAEGEDRARKAAEKALSSPLLERPVAGAKRLLLNVTGGKDLKLDEANEIATMISNAADNSVTDIIFGTVLDEDKGTGIQVTIIATDFFKPDRSSGEKESGLMEAKEGGSSKDYDDNFDVPAFLRRRVKG